jgi:plastocyanin
MATEGTARSGGLGWASLLRFSVIVTIVAGLAIQVLLEEAFDPVITGFQVAYVAGLALLPSKPKAGTIVIGVATLVLIGFGGFFFILALSQPKSTVEFIVNLVMLVAGITSAIAVIALLRRSTERGSSSAARKVATVGAVVVVVGLAFAVFTKLTLDEPAIRSGDLTLVAENIEFSSEELHANSGEVSIVIDNKDLAGHTFTIDKLDVDEALPGGTSTRFTFDAPSGTYRYYCAIPGHDETMHGTFTVH